MMAMSSIDRLCMTQPYTAASVFLSFIVVLAFALYLFNIDKRRRSLPPKVPAWPIVNHTFIQMRDDTPVILKRWGKAHGELFRTKAGTTDFIWLNSKEAVKELFDRRSAIYSSRQPMPMAFEKATGAKRITFAPYSKHWRDTRAVFHKVLTQKMAQDYSVIQVFEAKQLSVDLLNDPEDFYMHNRRYAASVIMQITYGWRIPKWDCIEIRRIFEVLGRFVQCRKPGQWLVDVFPTLANSRIFNFFSTWQRIGSEFHAADDATWMEFWNQMKLKVAQGIAPHCFGKILLHDFEKQGFSESQAAWICGGLIEAGSETTSATLNNCLYLMLSNPECIQLAHEELDRIIGPNRTPSFDDEPHLPIIRGMIKETLRMRPINKFGNNHFNTEDDWYKGYFIPKESIVMANWWAIHYSPEYYPDPEKFLPSRWVDYPHSAAKAAALPDGVQRDHLTYGGGRRICAGIHLAEKSLFINVARILWGFNIEIAKDENGQSIALDFSTGSLQPGSSSVVKPFRCVITPRSDHHAKILRQEWREADAEGIDLSHIRWTV